MQLSFWAIALSVIAYMGVFLPGGGNMQGDGQMGFQLYIVDFDGKFSQLAIDSWNSWIFPPQRNLLHSTYADDYFYMHICIVVHWFL